MESYQTNITKLKNVSILKKGKFKLDNDRLRQSDIIVFLTRVFQDHNDFPISQTFCRGYTTMDGGQLTARQLIAVNSLSTTINSIKIN